MAYAGIDDWQAPLIPALRARAGFDNDPLEYDYDWDFAESQLDAFEDGPAPEAEAAEAELPTSTFMASEFDFVLPNEQDEGRRQADRTAAMKGVNPGRKDGGIGHLFDLARTFIGTPYVFGAAGPEAFDCSGFTSYIYDRVFGAVLPHKASAQVSATTPVSKDQLQPGDLIFYRYGRLGHEVDHVEIFMGDGKQIGTSNPREGLDIDQVDWDNVAGFGRVVNAGKVVPRANDPMGGPVKTKTVTREVDGGGRTLVPQMLADKTDIGNILAGVLTDDVVAVRKVKTPTFKGAEGGLKAQLYRGFVDAGREDLARMVRTRDFATWIRQESGWEVGVTSPANNHGLANDGLFQIWRGHEFNDRGQVSRMSAYEQAQIVAKYFDLTPEDIRRYAEEIRGGRYHGWG